jgi:hypothetical protein
MTKPITWFLLGSFAITALVELAGIGVFASNRRYWEAIQGYQKQNRYADALPEALDRLYREEHGEGQGMAHGLLHGVMGMPRTLLSFAFIASNNVLGTRFYVSPDTAFVRHNNGNSYLAGFTVGVLMFVALLAIALPRDRRAVDEGDGEGMRGEEEGMRDEG